MKYLLGCFCVVVISIICSGWGFFGHQQINRIAVFTLPPEMIRFYKANIDYIRETSVNPDRRRFSSPDEAPRHYIDLDHYGDSAGINMPLYWQQAVEKYSEDTLKAYGIVPWHIMRMYYSLREAFLLRDPPRILKISAELGHYVADAHVPLHTTENYNGQLTGQYGIHAFWESRLPELYAHDFNYFVGRAEYLAHPQRAAWNAVRSSHAALDSVLAEEKNLSLRMGDRKYSFETKGRQTVKAYSLEYSRAYFMALDGMVERRMCGAIKMIGDLWFTAWIDGGQPDLDSLIDYVPSEQELEERKKELQQWKQKRFSAPDHESDANQD